MDKSTLRYSSNALGCETLSYATTVISKPPALGRELACRADLDMIQQQQQQNNSATRQYLMPAAPQHSSALSIPFHRLASGLKFDSPRSTDDGFLNPSGAWSNAP